MRILQDYSNYTNLPLNKNNISFGSTDRFYIVEGKKEMGNNSWIFREDINWHELAEFEITNFKNKDKVNIIQFAASDGSEGYTQTISLLENKKGVNVDKFFPIKAFDIDDFIVQKASSGNINLAQKDIDLLIANSIQHRAYFTRQNSVFTNQIGADGKVIQVHPNVILGPRETFKVADKLKEKINFKIGDMFEILPKIKDNGNSIVMCRNVLAYYDEKIIKFFIKTANQVLKPGSLFIVGKLDTDFTKIEKILHDNSFLKILRNVYIKV